MALVALALTVVALGAGGSGEVITPAEVMAPDHARRYVNVAGRRKVPVDADKPVFFTEI